MDFWGFEGNRQELPGDGFGLFMAGEAPAPVGPPPVTGAADPVQPPPSDPGAKVKTTVESAADGTKKTKAVGIETTPAFDKVVKDNHADLDTYRKALSERSAKPWTDARGDEVTPEYAHGQLDEFQTWARDSITHLNANEQKSWLDRLDGDNKDHPTEHSIIGRGKAIEEAGGAVVAANIPLAAGADAAAETAKQGEITTAQNKADGIVRTYSDDFKTPSPASTDGARSADDVWDDLPTGNPVLDEANGTIEAAQEELDERIASSRYASLAEFNGGTQPQNVKEFRAAVMKAQEAAGKDPQKLKKVEVLKKELKAFEKQNQAINSANQAFKRGNVQEFQRYLSQSGYTGPLPGNQRVETASAGEPDGPGGGGGGVAGWAQGVAHAGNSIAGAVGSLGNIRTAGEYALGPRGGRSVGFGYNDGRSSSYGFSGPGGSFANVGVAGAGGGYGGFGDMTGTGFSVGFNGMNNRDKARHLEGLINQLLMMIASGNIDMIETAISICNLKAKTTMIEASLHVIKAMQSYDKQMQGISDEMGKLSGKETDYNGHLAQLNADMNQISMTRQTMTRVLQDIMSMNEEMGTLEDSIYNVKSRESSHYRWA